MTFRIAIAAAAIALTAIALPAAPVSAQAPRALIAERSFIRFVSKQLNVPVEGRFRKFTANVHFDPRKPEATRAEFEVELASIDLGTEEGESELKRPLWFHVAEFPRARFVAKSVTAVAPGKYEAKGALTIKGITHDIATEFSHSESAGVRTVEGRFAVKRLQFRVGEKMWADTETVADDVLVRYRFVLPA